MIMEGIYTFLHLIDGILIMISSIIIVMSINERESLIRVLLSFFAITATLTFLSFVDLSNSESELLKLNQNIHFTVGLLIITFIFYEFVSRCEHAKVIVHTLISCFAYSIFYSITNYILL